LWDTGKRVARELQRVIDPIIPGLAYTVLQANGEGEFCVYIRHYGREPNPYPYSEGKRPIHGVIDDTLSEFDEEYPELVRVSRHIDSDVWLDKDTAEKLRKALEVGTDEHD
jgi:hypothetical protein